MAVEYFVVIKNLSNSEYITTTGSSLNITTAQTFTTPAEADIKIATLPVGSYESVWVSNVVS